MDRSGESLLPGRRPRGHRTGAFTLIELLIVLLVVGILGGLTLRSLSVWMPRAKLDGVTNVADTFFKRMRLMAIKRSTDIDIQLEDEGGNKVTVANMYAISGPSKRFALVATDSAGNEVARAPIPNPNGQTGQHIGLREINFPNETITLRLNGTIAATGEFRFGYETETNLMYLRELAFTNLAGSMDDTSYEFAGYLP